ncbi:MAG: amidase [Cyclobacteriaceae bacterium]
MRHFVFFLPFCLISFYSYSQSSDSLSIALDIIGLTFDRQELDSMSPSVKEEAENYGAIRNMPLPNDLGNSLVFTPPINKVVVPDKQVAINWGLSENVKMPDNLNDLAFYPVHQLASLIQERKVSSLQLTELFLARLQKYGDTLSCVITITDSLAIAQAKRADEEIAKGQYRGPLHGIPYGAKDLLAVAQYPTTWGAAPYQDQQLNYSATVVNKLEEAGAILVAKLTLGALAWGDVWYGGKTKNPWNMEVGSSGSSAGSASATVAGLVPFAIGSETWGSIVSPSTRCGATGLRPTFGRVSKHGAMALSWSMDKLGPICRNAIDCAIVLEAIRGTDDLDLSVRNYPYNYDSEQDIQQLRVGILESEFGPNRFNFQNDSILIAQLNKEGINLINKQLPTGIPTQALSFILSAEAAAAFDELTRTNRDDLMVRQIKNAWPNSFRASRLIPAVEYIQANRLRYQLTLAFNEMMKDIDVLIATSFSRQLLMTNLTGHPCMVLPDGSYANGNPGSITLIGNHFDEASILVFARYLQSLSDYEDEHPAYFQD